MAHFVMAEQYGFPINDNSDEANAARQEKICPFRKSSCNKKGGVCSITDGTSYPITCPERFKENNLIYKTASNAVFATEKNVIGLSEIPFLDAHDGSNSSPGRIDNVITLLNENNDLVDWFALEVQAVYFSGASMEPEVRAYEEKGIIPDPNLPEISGDGKKKVRRPDFRSSAPKRLLPQLEIKVPALRRWGKKMCVVVDKPFFQWMPEMESANDISNSDICWLVFELDTNESPYKLKLHKSFLATLEESRKGLVAAIVPPKPSVENKIMEAIRNDLTKEPNKRKKVYWVSN